MVEDVEAARVNEALVYADYVHMYTIASAWRNGDAASAGNETARTPMRLDMMWTLVSRLYGTQVLSAVWYSGAWLIFRHPTPARRRSEGLVRRRAWAARRL